MLIFIFGLAGSGKNYIAQTLSTNYNYHHWDADEALTNDMHQAIAQKQPFTEAMRDEFTQRIIEKTTELQKEHINLVITQALYKEANRNQLQKAFPEAKWLLAQTEPSILIKRLQARNNEVDEKYAEIIQQAFEQPKLSHTVITNNSNQTTIKNQLEKFLNDNDPNLKQTKANSSNLLKK